MSSTSHNNEDESVLLGSTIFADDGPSTCEQNAILWSLDSTVSGLPTQLETILALLQQQAAPFRPQPPVSPGVTDR